MPAVARALNDGTHADEVMEVLEQGLVNYIALVHAMRTTLARSCSSMRRTATNRDEVARLLGAGRIIATGRDDDQLREVQTLGADKVINTAVPDDALAQAYLDAKGDGYDVVLDYLWGRPTEILLRSLVPQTFAFPKPTRLIQIGESAGAGLVLAAEIHGKR